MIGMQLSGLMTYFSWLLVTELVDIECQIHDRDRMSVRENLPVAVGILNRAIEEKAKIQQGTVYLHCCQGLGRSPSVAAAYLYWFTENMTLDEACRLLIQRRPGSVPYDDAIRGATYDILGRNNGQDNFHALPPQAFATITADQKRAIQQNVTGRLAVRSA
jgi:hypothetical protein